MEHILTADNVWVDYFEKVDDKSAKCRKCKAILKYSINVSHFAAHLKAVHTDFLKGILKKDIITDEEYSSQVWNYGKQCENVFKVQCQICKSEAKLVSLRTPANLRDHFERCNTFGSSREPDTMSKIKVTVKNVWRFYKQLRETFEAECKHCEKKLKYGIKFDTILKHLRTHEDRIKRIAEENRRRAPDDEKSYLDQTTSTCMVCKNNFTNEQFFDHINKHGIEELYTLEVSKRMLEYVKTCEDDLEIICTICFPHTNHNFSFNGSALSNHVNVCNVKNKEEFTITVENIKNYYTIQEGVLQANCKHCGKEVDYTDNSEILDHIRNAHGRLIEIDLKTAAERDLKSDQTPYLDASNQCKICKAVFKNQEDTSAHIRGHSVKQVMKYEINNTLKLFNLKLGDFNVTCNQCQDEGIPDKNFSLSIASNIESHLYSCSMRD